MNEKVEQAVYRYDWTEVPPSIGVVEALGTLTDREPVELPTLNDSINPDALDALFEDSTGDRESESITVSFAYADHSVTVVADGTIIFERDAGRSGLDR